MSAAAQHPASQSFNLPESFALTLLLKKTSSFLIAAAKMKNCP
jgi:hypothetical protein